MSVRHSRGLVSSFSNKGFKFCGHISAKYSNRVPYAAQEKIIRLI